MTHLVCTNCRPPTTCDQPTFRLQLGPWHEGYARPRPGAWAVDCGDSGWRCHGRCLTHTAPGPTLDRAMLGWARAAAMRRLGLPHPWARPLPPHPTHRRPA